MQLIQRSAIAVLWAISSIATAEEWYWAHAETAVLISAQDVQCTRIGSDSDLGRFKNEHGIHRVLATNTSEYRVATTGPGGEEFVLAPSLELCSKVYDFLVASSKATSPYAPTALGSLSIPPKKELPECYRNSKIKLPRLNGDFKLVCPDGSIAR